MPRSVTISSSGSAMASGEVDPAGAVNEERLRVMLLVSSLELGGAERQAVYLANHLDPARFDVRVCSLSHVLPLAEHLREREQRLSVVPKRSRFDVTAVSRVAELMRHCGTQIVQAFLFDADMTARLASRRAGGAVVIGSERNADYRRPLIQRAAQRLTRSRCHAWIANSHAGGRFVQRQQGAAADQVFVVPNGVDVERFAPQDAHKTREELGVAPDDLMVGMVASFKPQKNHEMFLRVARRVRERMPKVRFVCVGEELGREPSDGLFKPGVGFHKDVAGYHRRVRALVDGLNLGDRLLLLGNRTDLPELYNAFDVTVLTSLHEGTPNVVLESMACGTPVVVTNVSDNAMIVRDGVDGFVVPVDDVEAMATRLVELLSDGRIRATCGRNARTHVTEQFSLRAMAQATGSVYEALWSRYGKRDVCAPVAQQAVSPTAIANRYSVSERSIVDP